MSERLAAYSAADEAQNAALVKRAKDWTEGHTYSDLTRRTLVVDGVSYTAAEVRRLVHDRHVLASENTRLRATLKRADRHLKLRTAALIRLIASDRSSRLDSGACGGPTSCSSGASCCSAGRSTEQKGSAT